MIYFPNCKINLGLNIVGKRPDGYHNLETIFVPVPMHDVVEIISADDGIFSFQSTGLPIPGEVETNLCIKAFRLLQSEYLLPEVNMHLHKVIPLGAGLGGGSADGAFTLRLVNEYFNLLLDTDQLKSYARVLGSDCSFFIENRALYAFERGDRFEPISLDLAGFTLLLVVPGVHVSTAEAYPAVIPAKPVNSLKELVLLPVELWKDKVTNDFEEPVFKRFPVIGEIKQKLYDAGAAYASMSGSGSAVYGLFNKPPEVGDVFRGMYTAEFLL
jgi:4-diphosphocytidyl-2-C-methyl-D-erythritol kinase